MSKIVRLEAENIKRIKAVNIEPNGAVFIVGGKENQGKSSVLDSIMYALGGEKGLPPQPLRNGTSKGSIKIDLGDLMVERTFTEKGSRLQVKSKEGLIVPSPQAILDKLFGRLSFDPLEFSRQKPKDQLAVMRELVGIDFTKLDADRAKAYAERTNVNRDVKQLEAELAALPEHKDAPELLVVMADLSEQLENAMKTNRANHDKRSEHGKIVGEINEIGRRIIEKRRTIAGLEAEIKTLESDQSRKKIDADTMGTGLALIEDEDTTPIREKMQTAEATNAKVRDNANRRKLAGKLAEAQGKSTALTTAIDGIDADKAKQIETAKFPVAGLGFDENGITFNGLPFEQAASSQRIRISAAVGLALNPKSPLILVRDGSLMGEESLAMLQEMAEQADAQVWVERVSEGEEVSIIIEDGSVKSVEANELQHA